jgi:hypothetical protein
LLGCCFVAAVLYKDIEDMAILINGKPQIMALPVDCQKDLVQVPLVGRLRATASQCIGVLLAKFPTPRADGLIRDEDPTGEQQPFGITPAEAKAEVQPDPMADDLGREAVVLIAIEALGRMA